MTIEALKTQENSEKLCFLGLLFCLLPFAKIAAFYQHYLVPKWTIVYLIAVLLQLYCFTEKETKVPKLEKEILITIFGLGIVTILNHLLFNISFLTPAFWDRLCFITISLSIYNLMRSHLLTQKQLLTITCVASGAFLLACLPEFYNNTDLSMTFGNINMSAEFVGFTLVLMIASRSQITKYLWAFDTLTVLCAIYCYYASSRSVFVAFIFTIAGLLYLKITSKQYVVKLMLLCSSIIMFIEFLPFLTTLTNTSATDMPITSPPKVYLIKEGSNLSRWQMLLATLQLIYNNPLGVGPGNYLWGFIPYSYTVTPEVTEMNLLLSPHNEYLRILAEDGIPFCLLSMAFFVLLLKHHRHKFSMIIKKHPMIIAFTIFFAVQALFQFPLQNAFPFLLTACFVGYTLSVLYPNTIQQPPKLLFPFASVIMLSFTIAFVISEALTFLYHDSSKMNQLATKLNHNNWFAFVQAANIELNEGNIDEADRITNQALSRHPNNYMAIGIKATIEDMRGHTKKACNLRRKVDGFFGGKSSHADIIAKQCKM